MYYCKTTLSFYMLTYFILSQILYAYSYKSKNIEKMFFYILNVHMSNLKWGQRSSSIIIGAFLQTVFLFFSLVQHQDVFF